MPAMLRPLQADTDLPQLLPLLNFYFLEPTSLDLFRLDREQEIREGKILQEIVAPDDQGHITGYSYIKREYGDWDRTRIRIWLTIDPQHRAKGIGSLLYNNAIQFATEYGAVKVDSSVRDDDGPSLHFAQQRGFHIDRHMFGSRLDVLAFDETPFAGAIQAAESTGIRFFSMADLGNTPEAQRKLYELNRYVDSEIPGERLFPSFEEFSEMVFHADWYRADGQIIAADGDRWVGMSAVGHFPEKSLMEVMITGVDSAYRGRKIGMALKILTHRCAQHYGVQHLDTGNDSHNAPMLAINQKLGYKKLRGTYYLQKQL